MAKYLTSEEAFSKCEAGGKWVFLQEINLEQISSMLNIAENDLKAGNRLITTIKKEDSFWSSIYKLYYDTLHCLSEAFLRFDRFKSENH